MKIAVTGHTSGIGKGLYDFYKKGHEVLGFSRSNGYDIDKNQDEITAKVEGCDVFFNNAYSGFAQTELLLKLWEKWRDSEKLIINTSSAITEVFWPHTYHPVWSLYKVNKLSLEQAVGKLQQTPSKCQISVITPGFVQTKFLPKEFKKEEQALCTQKVVEIADFIVSSWKNYKINDIFFGEIY